MSAGRTYTIRFSGVSISAVQDLCAAYAGATMAIEVVSLTLGTTTALANSEQVPISVKYVASTVTAGSGGTVFVPVPDTPTDSAATFTARVNDTTQATSATVRFPHVDVWNEIQGYQWIFPERARPSCGLNAALVFSLDAAPGAARVTYGSMKVRELF